MRGIGISLGLGSRVLGAGVAPPPPSPYDPDAQNYFNLVVTAGGAISDPIKDCVNDFVLALKADDIWTRLVRVNLFCTDGFAGLQVPLIDGGIGLDDAISGFTGANYSQAVGLTSNGVASRYVDTRVVPGITPAGKDAGTYGMFAYTKNVAANNSRKTLMGGILGFHAARLRFGDGFLGNALFAAMVADGVIASNQGSPPPDGMYGIRRTATDQLLTRGVLQLSSGGLNAPGTIRSIYVGMDHDATAVDPFNGLLLGYAIAGNTAGNYFSGTHLAALNSAMQDFMECLGRVVPPPVYDVDAQDYFNRVSIAGGTLSTTVKGHVNTLVVQLKAGGIWTKIVRMNLLCTDTFTGLMVPVKRSVPQAMIDINEGFVSGDYAQSVGLSNNGSAKSFHTGVGLEQLLSTIPVGNRPTLGFFVFATQKINPDPYVEFRGSGLIGNRSAAIQCSLMIVDLLGDRGFLGGIGGVGQTFGETLPSGTGAPRGLYGARRGVGDLTRGSIDGANIAAAPIVSSNFFSLLSPVRVGARDNPVEDYMDGSIGAYIVTAGPTGADYITDANLLALSIAMNTFQAALGR